MTDTDPTPTTEAGRMLLSAHDELFGDDVRLDVNARIIAIEAEARAELDVAARALVDQWDCDDCDPGEAEPFCWTCGMRRDLPHDVGCTFVALRAALARQGVADSRTCIECDEPWPCEATVTRRKDGIPHRLGLGRCSDD